MATSLSPLANMNSLMVTTPQTPFNNKFGFFPLPLSTNEILGQKSSSKKLQLGTKNFHFQGAKVTWLPRNSPSRCSLHDELTNVNKEVVGLDPSLAVKSKAADLSYGLKGTSLFLVGINNTIKTRLGSMLADVLRYYYFDSDELIVEAAGGEAAARSYRERDEKGFLDSETEVLEQLSSMGRLIVCAGDGAVQSSTNLALLRHGISVWIDIPLHMVAREAIESGNENPAEEPVSTSDHSEVLAKLTEQYGRMKGAYAIADATVSLQRVAGQLGYDNTDAVTIEDLAVETLKEIEKLTRVKKMMEAAARPF